MNIIKNSSTNFDARPTKANATDLKAKTNVLTNLKIFISTDRALLECGMGRDVSRDEKKKKTLGKMTKSELLVMAS